jgi:hypothetical protein
VEYFDEEACGHFGPHVFMVVNEISAHSCVGAVGLLFLSVYRAYEPDVCEVLASIAENVRFVDELDGVGAFYTSARALGEATKFVGSRNVPGIFESGVLEELMIFECLSGFHINDGVWNAVVPHV